MAGSEISIEQISGKKGRARFVDLGRAFAAREPHAVPQLRAEQLELVDPSRNPFFGHASHQFFIATRGGKDVGRISAHIDHLALLSVAEEWLRAKGMTHVLGPISMSIWEEPGLLVKGQDHSPTIMMGHHPAHYRGWIEAAGYAPSKSLMTYDLDINREFPPLIQRIVKSGERNERIMQEYVYPRITAGSRVTVNGYTDAIGSEEYNLKLSQERADAVRAVLLARMGEEATERVVAIGHGETDPVFSNEVQEGRFYNRTVSLVIERYPQE